MDFCRRTAGQFPRVPWDIGCCEAAETVTTFAGRTAFSRGDLGAIHSINTGARYAEGDGQGHGTGEDGGEDRAGIAAGVAHRAASPKAWLRRPAVSPRWAPWGSVPAPGRRRIRRADA